MAEDYKGKHLRKDITPKTDYSSYIPTPRISRFTTLYPIYPTSLRALKEESRKRKKFKNTMKSPGLERKLEIAVSFGGIIVSMLYFSTNLTSFVIGNLNQTDINIVGAIFFVCGVLGILMSL